MGDTGMGPPAGWLNPITTQQGGIQKGVAAQLLLPARRDLVKNRLERQRQLLKAGQKRFTPIQVTTQGVIYDGHHGARAAAENGFAVDVLIVDQPASPVGSWLMDLPVR
jgi:hypothetical protein